MFGANKARHEGRILQDPVTAMIGGSAVLGGLGSYLGGKSAADATNNATNAQMGMFSTINKQNAPWRDAGKTALSQMTDLTGPGGSMSHPFDNQDLMTNLAPNYQFQLGQGIGALNNNMNLTGGINSGNTLKAINDYSQNFAGNAYQNAFNNYQSQNNSIFNRLSTIAGLGTNANQTTANMGSSTATGVGNSMMAGGQAQASAYMGMGNALGNGLSTVGMMNYLNG